MKTALHFFASARENFFGRTRLAGLVLSILLAASAGAKISGVLRYRVTNQDRIVITDCPSSVLGILEIPATIEDEGISYPVTGIGIRAFEGCSMLSAITIPDSVRGILDEAFLNCSRLSTVTFLGHAPGLGTNVFQGTAPDAVVRIGENGEGFGSVFGNLMVEGEAPESFLSYRVNEASATLTNCFSGFAGEIVIPDIIEGKPVTEIAAYAFKNCRFLTTIVIPRRITSIGSYAFQNCNSLTTVVIPDGVTTIGRYTFQNCSSLTNVAIPDGVTDIGSHAFSGCSSLREVTIPDSLTGLQRGAFSGCVSLRRVQFLGHSPPAENENSCRIITRAGPTFEVLDGPTLPFSSNNLHDIGLQWLDSDFEHGFMDYVLGAADIPLAEALAVPILNLLGYHGQVVWDRVEAFNSVTTDSMTPHLRIVLHSIINKTSDFSNTTWDFVDGCLIDYYGEPIAVGVGIPDFRNEPISRKPFSEPATIYVPAGASDWGEEFSGRPVVRGLPVEAEGYRLNVITDSARGQVVQEPDLPSYEEGAVVTLTATPAAGYLFTSWAGDGSGSANPLQVTMDATKTITVVFSPDEGDNDSDGLTNYEEIITYQSDPDLRDSNADGIEDGKAVELGYSPTFNFQNLLGFLESNPGTLFPNLCTQAQLDAERAAGQEDVTNSPETYGLLTQAAHDAAIAILEGEKTALAAQVAAVEAERDARPTAEQLAAVESERDAVVADIQLAYDEVRSAAGVAEGDLAPVVSGDRTFDLVWTNTEDPSDTITMTMEFAGDSITNSSDIHNTRVPGSVLTIDYQGSVTTHNEPRIAFQSPGELDFSEELIGQAGFGTAPGTPGSGDFNVFGITVPGGTFNGQNYFTVQAPNGSLYTLTSMKIASRFSFLELGPLSEIYFELAEANESALAERDAAIAERDALPTQAAYDAVVAERDARFTEDQIRALSADYTIGLNAAGNVQMKINFFESSDLATFAPLTVTPESLSVVDGSICLEFAPTDNAAFFRFNVD